MNAMDRVNTTRLLAYIKEHMGTALHQFVGEPNDQLTRSMTASAIRQFTENLKVNCMIEDFGVTCDETNNPPFVIDRGHMVCDVYIKPIMSLDVVYVTLRAESGTLNLDSGILTKKYHYAAYERAMSILEKK